MIPNILSIAGSDPSGGAGVQADIEAISANGGYAMAAITGLTAQNTRGVRAVQIISSDMVEAQIAALRDDIRIDAIKIGMLGDATTIAAVADALEGLDAPIVLDPVMVAKGGDRLLAADAVAALRDLLLPRATVLTPNLPEAADLLGVAEARNLDEMRAQGEALLGLGSGTVLMKGPATSQDGPPPICSCPRAAGGSVRAPHAHAQYPRDRLHPVLGACRLDGRGHPASEAARRAKAHVAAAIAAADTLTVGSGHGPVDHFHALRETSR